MEPITILTAIATVLATKALEKTGENLGDAVTGRVRQLRFHSTLSHTHRI